MHDNDAPDPYEVLGVPKDAPPEEIKKAYRRRARETHPDAGGDGEEFRQLAIAYDILGDADKRKYFDRTGKRGRDASELESHVADLIRAAFYEDKSDPLGWIRAQVNSLRESRVRERDGLKLGIAKLKRKLTKFEQANKKAKNPEAKALVISCLKHFIKDDEETIAGLSDSIEMGSKILKYLDGLEYAPEMPTYSSFDRRSAGGGFNPFTVST